MTEPKTTVTPAADHFLLYLLVGLEAQREREAGVPNTGARFYPYPDTLRVAWNALACHGLTGASTAAPRTLHGLVKRCARPLAEWLPAMLIPPDFPATSALLHDGVSIDLTEVAGDFLNRHLDATDFGKTPLQDAKGLTRFVENQAFVDVLNRLRHAPWTAAKQADYVQLRRFLITHPLTTRGAIRDTFAGAFFVTPGDVGKLYRDCDRNETMFVCDKCGLLRGSERGHLAGSKPGMCADHAADAPHVRRAAWEPGLCRLSDAVHTRVCLPGRAEIALFDRLHALQAKYPNRITAVEEYPDIDRYDGRVVFADGAAWVLDVKDYADPHELSRQLSPMPTDDDRLRYDRAFYVVPGRRAAQSLTYLADARAGAELPQNHELCDDDLLVAQVESHAKKRAKKETNL